MMFKGTKRLAKGEIDGITARNGGFNNAFTSFDYTAYYFSFASDRWWPVLDIEADRMVDCIFDPGEFEIERQVILEELKMEEDQPWEVLRQAIHASAFADHPYRHPVIGTFEEVSALSMESVLSHYDRYYVPANATLVVVGDVDVNQVLPAVESCFARIPKYDLPPLLPAGDQVPLVSQQFAVDKPTSVTRMLLALRAPSTHDDRVFSFHLLDKALSEGRLCRLYSRLIEKEQVVALATTDLAETNDPYLYFIRLELEDGADVQTVLALVLEELAELCRIGLSPDELKRAKNQTSNEFLGDFDLGFDVAFQLGLMETLGRKEIPLRYLQKIDSVTEEQVLETAREFLSPETVLTAFMEPKTAN
jgi:zinc protease